MLELNDSRSNSIMNTSDNVLHSPLRLRFPFSSRKIKHEESASIMLARELSEKVESYYKSVDPFESLSPRMQARDSVEGSIRMSMPVSLQKSTNLALLEEKRGTPDSSKVSAACTPVLSTKSCRIGEGKSGFK